MICSDVAEYFSFNPGLGVYVPRKHRLGINIFCVMTGCSPSSYALMRCGRSGHDVGGHGK